MRIAILYICTGKYNVFWDGFYKSSEKYFLSGQAEKEYFVFTDNMDLCKDSHVHLHYRECQGFPFDSLFRFDLFLSIEDEIKDFDYIYFFNANMQFVKPVGKEFLPTVNDGYLAAVLHPLILKRPFFFYSYERNKKSLAYITLVRHHKYRYFMGSLNGGRAKEYLELVRTCAQNTRTDYENGIIAMVHDESHLNRYLFDHKCKALAPSYAYPEGKSMGYDPIILIRDKVKVDSYFNKGRDTSKWGKVKMVWSWIYRAILWVV